MLGKFIKHVCPILLLLLPIALSFDSGLKKWCIIAYMVCIGLIFGLSHVSEEFNHACKYLSGLVLFGLTASLLVVYI